MKIGDRVQLVGDEYLAVMGKIIPIPAGSVGVLKSLDQDLLLGGKERIAKVKFDKLPKYHVTIGENQLEPEKEPPFGIWVLQLWQPYASLCVIDAKKYETRGWSAAPRYFGPVVIYATQKRFDWASYGYSSAPFVKAIEALQKQGKIDPYHLVYGAALGVVDLVGSYRTESVRDSLSLQELAFGDYSNGRWCFKLENPRPFAAPIPMRGRQAKFLRWQPQGAALAEVQRVLKIAPAAEIQSGG